MACLGARGPFDPALRAVNFWQRLTFKYLNRIRISEMHATVPVSVKGLSENSFHCNLI